MHILLQEHICYLLKVVSEPKHCARMWHNVSGFYHIKYVGYFDLYASLWARILGLWKQFEPQY